MRRTLLHIMCALLYAIAAHSCDTIGLELCESSHPHLSKLIVTYAWPEEMTKDGLVPEKSWIIANRPSDPLRYLFGWFTDTNDKGREMAYLNSDSAEAKKPFFNMDSLRWFSDRATLADAQDSCGIRLGEYQVITTNCSFFLQIDSIDSFFHRHDIFPSHISARYNTEIIADSIDPALHDWVDYNPKYPFVKDIGPVFFDQQIVQSVKGFDTEINFAPQVISQRIDLEFNVETDDSNLVLDSIRGELSGVVQSKAIFTGYLNMDATQSCRVLFNANVPGTPTSDGTTRRWASTATVNVLGLCEPTDAEKQTGPGILHLAAYTHYIELADPEVEGSTNKLVKRTFFWGINLHDVLKAHPVTRQTEDLRHHVMTSNHETLRIMNRLKMKLSDISGDGDIENWPDDPDKENGDFDIEF